MIEELIKIVDELNAGDQKLIEWVDKYQNQNADEIWSTKEGRDFIMSVPNAIRDRCYVLTKALEFAKIMILKGVE